MLITTTSLDFTAIDVTGNGAQALEMDKLDVLAFEAADRNVRGTTNYDVLILKGSVADTPDLSGFGAPVSTVSFVADDYALCALDGNVVLAVDTDFVLV